MAWILVLALAALAAAIAIAARRGLLALQDSTQHAWSALESQLLKRQQLATRIVELCAKPLAEERETLSRARAAAGAVIAATKSANVPALAAADKSHRAAFSELFARAESHPHLSRSAAFDALRERMATLDARVDERREHYNAVVSVLNFRCVAFPYNVVARTTGVRPAAFLP